MAKTFRICVKIPDEWEGINFKKTALERWPHIPIHERYYSVLRELAHRAREAETPKDALPYPWYDPQDIKATEQQGSSYETINGKQTHVIWARGKPWVCPCNRGELCAMPETEGA